MPSRTHHPDTDEMPRNMHINHLPIVFDDTTLRFSVPAFLHFGSHALIFVKSVATALVFPNMLQMN